MPASHTASTSTSTPVSKPSHKLSGPALQKPASKKRAARPSAKTSRPAKRARPSRSPSSPTTAITAAAKSARKPAPLSASVPSVPIHRKQQQQHVVQLPAAPLHVSHQSSMPESFFLFTLDVENGFERGHDFGGGGVEEGGDRCFLEDGLALPLSYDIPFGGAQWMGDGAFVSAVM